MHKRNVFCSKVSLFAEWKYNTKFADWRYNKFVF